RARLDDARMWKRRGLMRAPSDHSARTLRPARRQKEGALIYRTAPIGRGGHDVIALALRHELIEDLTRRLGRLVRAGRVRPMAGFGEIVIARVGEGGSSRQ